MIPVKGFATKHYDRKKSEYNKRDNFLNDFKLHQRESPAIAYETIPVGRHLKRVFEQRQEPAEENNENERSGVGNRAYLLQLDVTVPSQSHKDIRHEEHHDGLKCGHASPPFSNAIRRSWCRRSNSSFFSIILRREA